MLDFLKGISKRSPFIYSSVRTLQMALDRNLEREMAVLPFIVDRNRLAIDVGANTGAYVHRLLHLGANVVAIEANPQLVDVLKSLYGKKKLEVVWAAASSEGGRASLRIPNAKASYRHGMSTIEQANTLGGGEAETIDVPKVTLDSLNLPATGFLKIDVEGHEHSVLLGAQELIARDHPAILIEAEDRHRPDAVESVRSFLDGFGYRGFMLDNGLFKSIANFDVSRDQVFVGEDIETLNSGHYRGRYINNFIFLP